MLILGSPGQLVDLGNDGKKWQKVIETQIPSETPSLGRLAKRKRWVSPPLLDVNFNLFPFVREIFLDLIFEAITHSVNNLGSFFFCEIKNSRIA